jgi:hypothetical protein
MELRKMLAYWNRDDIEAVVVALEPFMRSLIKRDVKPELPE